MPSNIQSGIGALGNTLASGLNTYLGQDAREFNAESDYRKSSSEIMKNQAQASYLSKKAEIAANLESQRNNALRTLPSRVAGINPGQSAELSDYRESGQFGPARFGPQQPGIAPTQEAPAIPEWFTPEVDRQSRQGDLLADIIRSATSSNPGNIQDALAGLEQSGLGQRLLRGDIPQEMKDIAMAMFQGKGSYSQSGGRTLNTVSGEQGALPEDSPPPKPVSTSPNKKVFDELMAMGTPREIAKAAAYKTIREIKDPNTGVAVLVDTIGQAGENIVGALIPSRVDEEGKPDTFGPRMYATPEQYAAYISPPQAPSGDEPPGILDRFFNGLPVGRHGSGAGTDSPPPIENPGIAPVPEQAKPSLEEAIEEYGNSLKAQEIDDKRIKAMIAQKFNLKPK